MDSHSTPLSPRLAPLDLFLGSIEKGSAIFYCGEIDHEITGKMIRYGYRVEIFPHLIKDLRFLTVPENSLHGVWWNNAHQNYSLEDAQRILNILFKGLRPRIGRLTLTFSSSGEKNWKPLALQSMLRQSGYVLEQSFERENNLLYICRRV